ncbi:MAG TPA: glycosyltransferase family protein [Burkholderiales bacterium]|nr:glycosyltransferase family protein [Burkholderiales bacterium]
MRTVAILQARTSSSRLPGKVLKPLFGRPMLARQIERVRRAARLDELVVATSVDASDDALEALCREEGVACFRGSLDDVLDRFYRAAEAQAAETVVRLTGDCPLADPDLIDALVEFFFSGGYDYASNAVPPTFPDGLDAEVLGFGCLRQAWRQATLPSQREHVTSFIYNHPERFRVGSYRNPVDLSHLRWTVDEAEDFEMVSGVYAELYPVDPRFGWQDVLRLLERRPELISNSRFRRNEGYDASLRRDNPA